MTLLLLNSRQRFWFLFQVPDTSRVAALNLAQKLQLPYREGFIKNRYVGRTFIMPGQQMR
jgi:amidophosphoribosyltransferase